MTADIDKLVLEHLRHIRGRVDQMADDISDLKHRMTRLEGATGLVTRSTPSQVRPCYSPPTWARSAPPWWLGCDGLRRLRPDRAPIPMSCR